MSILRPVSRDFRDIPPLSGLLRSDLCATANRPCSSPTADRNGSERRCTRWFRAPGSDGGREASVLGGFCNHPRIVHRYICFGQSWLTTLPPARARNLISVSVF